MHDAVSGEPVPDRGGAHAYAGPVRWEYRPELDGDPDPGEVVWTWVAFEDDPSIGKDRPIAVVGRTDDGRMVALMMSSRNHTGHPDWIAIGSGPWDREGRPSWVRRDRLLAVSSRAVRREGAVLPRSTYDLIRNGLTGTATPPPAPRRGFVARLRALVSRSGGAAR